MIPQNAEVVFKGVLFDVYQWKQKLFDESLQVFEAVKRKDGVQILATYEDKIFLLEEEQPYVGKFVSIPGGIIDESETPLDACRRELKEELGVISETILDWKKTDMGSKVQWITHYLIAKNCSGDMIQKLDPGEKIKPFLVTFDEFLEFVLRDDFRNKDLSNMILKMIHNKTIDDFRKILFE